MEVIGEYKYLGCTVTEHMNCGRMIEERAREGSRALSAWLTKCRTSVGEVKGGSFTRMWESLVQSVLLYAAEIWGCSKKLGPVEQVQVRTGRIFLGVNRRHPKVSCRLRWVCCRFNGKLGRDALCYG